MSAVTIDIGQVDIHFDDIAEQLVSSCEEGDFLSELARQNESFAAESEDGAEKAFSLEFAKRLRELAAWFQENAK